MEFEGLEKEIIKSNIEKLRCRGGQQTEMHADDGVYCHEHVKLPSKGGNQKQIPLDFRDSVL